MHCRKQSNGHYFDILLFVLLDDFVVLLLLLLAASLCLELDCGQYASETFDGSQPNALRRSCTYCLMVVIY